MSNGRFMNGFDSRRGTTLRHGEYNSLLHRIWCSMRQRCTNPKDQAYPDYGGRGIKVCERWDSYEAFRDDMGPRPPGATVDRKNNDGDYCPDNCRWATRKQQNNNRRDNVRLTHNGKTQTVPEWADELGVKPGTIHMRLKRGWTASEALTTPMANRGQLV